MTRLFSGEKVAKNTPRVEMIGEIDELSSLLGVAKCHAARKSSKKNIAMLQQTLFLIAAELATSKKKSVYSKKRLNQKMLRDLEKRCEILEAKLSLPKKFIFSGGNLASAHLDYARSVARRCERKVVELFKKKMGINRLMLIWFNRLSDFLFLLACSEKC